VRPTLAEVALGLAEGRERAAVVSHVEICDACRAELAALASVADSLTTLAPAAEPPPGFEARVVSRLGRLRDGGDGAPSARRRVPGRRLAGSVAVAAALLIVGGFAGWVARSPHHGATTGSQQIATPASGALVSGGRDVGQAVLVSGYLPWMSVSVTAYLGSGPVTCRVSQAGRGTWVVGVFDLEEGWSYWAAPLPAGATLSAGRPAHIELVGRGGTLLASAVVPT